MQICVLGVGDAFTSQSFGSSALIRAHDEFLLLDCPDPIHRVIREGAASAGWEVDALGIHEILLTHLHGDHSNGLESFGFHRMFARAQELDDRRLILRTHIEAAKRLWPKLAPAMDASSPEPGRHARLDDFFELDTFEPNMPFQAVGLTVEARMGEHPIPTCGFKITDPASGGTLGWSGDTTFQMPHIEWLSSADLIIHECNVGRAHTHIDELNALPSELKAKMRLIHLPDDFDPLTTDIARIEQGEVIEL